MEFKKITIKNFKSIKCAEIELTKLVCIVGENNSGKSSILKAIDLFFNGGKISDSEYYNKANEIELIADFESIEESDILKLEDQHRDKIKDIILDGKITFSRVYSLDNDSRLRYYKWIPKDERFNKDKPFKIIEESSAAQARPVLQELLPEYGERFEGLTNKVQLKEALNSIIRGMDISQKKQELSDLPTGISNSLKALFPDIIYIEAIKDINDEVKTKESATFGKIISLLMKSVQSNDSFIEIQESFNKLKSLLNKYENENGEIEDNRIKQVKDVEQLIRGYLSDSFPNIDLEIIIPPPELKNVFNTAGILLNDGVLDKIETKGDGIKRSVLFALLRSYVDISKSNTAGDSLDYIFLFEEPELFLHPSAQKILFDTLTMISDKHYVFITTHSPTFFQPESIGTFIKISKNSIEGETPFAELKTVNFLTQMPLKEAFKAICYENNSAAFFAKKVLLVEGDSDLIFFRHLSKLLNPDWNFETKNIPIIRIYGKSNINKMEQFFRNFNIEVFTILDRDALFDGFELLNVTEQTTAMREKFITTLDKYVIENMIEANISAEKIKECIGKYSWREKYNLLKVICQKVKDGEPLTHEDVITIDCLFESETQNKRRMALNKIGDFDEFRELLIMLREQRIFVLSKGCVEDYYPTDVSGRDKPTKAFNACKLVSTSQKAREIYSNEADEDNSEFDSIFSSIFS